MGLGKRLGALASIAAMSLGTMVLASPSAQASTTCITKSKHYGISDGSISTRVGWVEMHVEICTDGNRITSAAATSSSDTTGPGDAAGFDIDFNTPYRTSFNSGGPTTAGGFGYTSKGRLRDCIPYTTTWCSDSEDFMVHAHVDMFRNPDRIPYALPTGTGWFAFHGRWFRVIWSHACTNSVCGVKFH